MGLKNPSCSDYTATNKFCRALHPRPDQYFPRPGWISQFALPSFCGAPWLCVCSLPDTSCPVFHLLTTYTLNSLCLMCNDSLSYFSTLILLTHQSYLFIIFCYIHHSSLYKVIIIIVCFFISNFSFFILLLILFFIIIFCSINCQNLS